MRKSLLLAIASLVFSQSALAGEGDIGPVKIEHLGIIATATGGHAPGNMEIKIQNGFTLPPGVNCDKNYITTRKQDDPDRVMFYMLLKVQTTTQPVRLRITDNPIYTAFAGRCSLEIVDLQ
jgi:hypothetical protein